MEREQWVVMETEGTVGGDGEGIVGGDGKERVGGDGEGTVGGDVVVPWQSSRAHQAVISTRNSAQAGQHSLTMILIHS